MAKAKSQVVYVCENCGEEFVQWAGKCSNCGEWNTIKEVRLAAEPSRGVGGRVGYAGAQAERITLSAVSGQQSERVATSFGELDRVLGGGLVAGSVLLLGGDPGIGKSTLLLQLVQRLADADPSRPVLYVSGEESPAQLKLRAERLGLSGRGIEILPVVDVHAVEAAARELQPQLLVIDSIQTMHDPAFPSTPGSLVQVRETALRFQRLAKTSQITTVLVGHLTKEGTVAGPRTLEHMVDVVLYLEGEPQHQLRVLRAVKNRFGDVAESGIFAMRDRGLIEVSNPGSFLLSERLQAPGSVLSAVLEGSRPVLIEVQALTTASPFGSPRRTASGFDLNRLHLLIAVLQKHARLPLADQDVYLNIVGGLKVKDPAIDAAVCLAIASSITGSVVPEKLCVFGEVGLAGEIRSVTGQSRRAKDVQSLGYEVVPSMKRVTELLQVLS
jgi:DNA repair protein RadA/Sms